MCLISPAENNCSQTVVVSILLLLWLSRLRLSPAARHILDTHGIDPKLATPTGPRGLITKEWVWINWPFSVICSDQWLHAQHTASARVAVQRNMQIKYTGQSGNELCIQSFAVKIIWIESAVQSVNRNKSRDTGLNWRFLQPLCDCTEGNLCRWGSAVRRNGSTQKSHSRKLPTLTWTPKITHAPARPLSLKRRLNTLVRHHHPAGESH